MKVALLPKKTRGEAVSFSARRCTSATRSRCPGKASIGTLTGSMLTRGTTKKSRQEIDDAFDKLRAKVAVGGSQTGASASRPDVPRATPRRAAADRRGAARAVVPGRRARHAQARSATRSSKRRAPSRRASRSARCRGTRNPYPPGDPRYAPTLDESIANNDAVTVDDVKRFHAKFYGASNAELAIVGDFDADAMRALVTELFGGWKSPSPYARVPEPFRPNQPVAMRLTVPDKANAFLIGMERIPVNDMSADYPALLVASFILGDSSSARIPERLRQKDGLSYGAATFFQPSAIDANSAIGAYAIFAPENLAQRAHRLLGGDSTAR